MHYNKVNNIVGWVIGLIACTVFVMTMEPTGSFWDCGEFVSSCYHLQIPHPPGAPLFILMGRLFIILFGDNPHTAARGVNFMSAIGSGLSILFLFWSITHFARKLVTGGQTGVAGPSQTPTIEPTSRQTFIIMATGVVGALSYTFCDSFWYSAVEGEVYATSAFFTALVFWAILKWEQNADKPGADKWLIFIFYMMGLSIGVHLLNLLTIPAIVMVYYFKRYKPTTLGTIIAFILGCVITGIVQVVVIQYTIKGAGAFDIWFVNSLGLPFFSGFAFFFVLLAVLMVIAIRWAVRNGYYYLKIGLWSAAFMLLGYSTYFTTMIRSSADPGVDMYNVDNPVSLVGYLSRDQYGDWPIVYGPDYQDRAPRVSTGTLYIKGKEKYDDAGKTTGEEWGNTPSSHLFPRMWDPNNDRGQIDAYKSYGGVAEGENPTMANNIKYFISYQNWEMFLRYFLWNYSGKQNDLQGFGNSRDGNAITGIPFIDNIFLGDQSRMPDTARKDNKSYNRMFFLPVILGLIGFFIVVYLNQAGFQPRERDYAFAGACYAFAIWIGLGVIWVAEMLEKYALKGRADAANYAAAGLCFLAVPVLMGSQEWDDHDRSKKTLARDLGKDYLESCPPNAILFSFGDNDTYPLWYAQEVEGIRPDVRVMNYSLLGTSLPSKSRATTVTPSCSIPLPDSIRINITTLTPCSKTSSPAATRVINHPPRAKTETFTSTCPHTICLFPWTRTSSAEPVSFILPTASSASSISISARTKTISSRTSWPSLPSSPPTNGNAPSASTRPTNWKTWVSPNISGRPASPACWYPSNQRMPPSASMTTTWPTGP
jgi:hypothetical protein